VAVFGNKPIYNRNKKKRILQNSILAAFVRIKNGLKILNFVDYVKFKRKQQQVQAITNNSSRISSTKEVQQCQEYLYRRALLGVTGLGLTHILCKYFAQIQGHL
jgi:hypothetical protein